MKKQRKRQERLVDLKYLHSRFFVDARVQTIYAGSSEIMKEVIARGMLGK